MTPEEMDTDEYMRTERASSIPKRRVAQGWHWCDDWDDMLVGPGMLALVGCTCRRPVLDVEKERMQARFDKYNAEEQKEILK